MLQIKQAEQDMGTIRQWFVSVKLHSDINERQADLTSLTWRP